jgi:hypothetical protein
MPGSGPELSTYPTVRICAATSRPAECSARIRRVVHTMSPGRRNGSKCRADSTGRCNGLMKSFCWRIEAWSLSWTFIEPSQCGQILSLPGRKISALFGRFRDKWRRYMLNLLASALRTIRMSGFMFSKMFGMFEHFAALLAPVLVSRHGIPPTRIPHVVLTRYCQRRPECSNHRGTTNCYCVRRSERGARQPVFPRNPRGVSSVLVAR